MSKSKYILVKLGGGTDNSGGGEIFLILVAALILWLTFVVWPFVTPINTAIAFIIISLVHFIRNEGKLYNLLPFISFPIMLYQSWSILPEVLYPAVIGAAIVMPKMLDAMPNAERYLFRRQPTYLFLLLVVVSVFISISFSQSFVLNSHATIWGLIPFISFFVAELKGNLVAKKDLKIYSEDKFSFLDFAIAPATILILASPFYVPFLIDAII